MMISNHLNVPVLQAQLVGDGSAFAVTLNCVTCSAVVPLDVAKKRNKKKMKKVCLNHFAVSTSNVKNIPFQDIW